MTSDHQPDLDRLCRLVASRAPAADVESALSSEADEPGGDRWASVRVESDADGKVEFVHLESGARPLQLEDLRALGEVEELPAFTAGDPSSHLLVYDRNDLPELCRVVIAANEGDVRALSLQPDIRL